MFVAILHKHADYAVNLFQDKAFKREKNNKYEDKDYKWITQEQIYDDNFHQGRAKLLTQ